MITCFGFISLELTNVPLTIFTFLGGAVAIGVGFGSQNILNNFISGLILLAEQPIRVGDLIDIDGLSGNVEKIGARSTRVKTGANLEIIVPNSKFLESNVTNWTLSDTRMRTVVKVGVAYGSPTERVAAILKQAVDECPLALPAPEPIILFKDFGDNSLSFEVHFWIYVRTMMQARKIESDLRYIIDGLLRAADISIAFPQRDVHLDTVKPIEVNIRQLAEGHGLSVRRTDAA
jgi:small-conductance mechanosensitive channel